MYMWSDEKIKNEHENIQQLGLPPSKKKKRWRKAMQGKV
jgi:hypothetical protein